MGRRTTRLPAERWEFGADGTLTARSRPDTVAVEEPLEIRVAGRTLTTTMRTPGDDFDLTLGWLLSERAVEKADDVATMMHCTDVDEQGSPTFNVVDAALAPGVTLSPLLSARTTTTTSACGVCGSDSIDAILRHTDREEIPAGTPIDPRILLDLPPRMRAAQPGFDRTGGVHAAALFDREGTLLCVREDVGRHNAVDKVIGWAARAGDGPAHDRILLVSGRAGFELVQKCALARVPVMAAVSAPTALAVETARRTGLTLVGFLRPPRMTVYTGAHRLQPPPTTH
ncbi:MAG: formate dehydrogenase accessory sulfurtransferase FdhD [Mobilicoccus sp.]|nr:formate dehydrogenase accessory sulfurtransferase FdhD [Mobilicoccus sp.]